MVPLTMITIGSVLARAHSAAFNSVPVVTVTTGPPVPPVTLALAAKPSIFAGRKAPPAEDTLLAIADETLLETGVLLATADETLLETGVLLATADDTLLERGALLGATELDTGELDAGELDAGELVTITVLETLDTVIALELFGRLDDEITLATTSLLALRLVLLKLTAAELELTASDELLMPGWVLEEVFATVLEASDDAGVEPPLPPPPHAASTLLNTTTDNKFVFTLAPEFALLKHTSREIKFNKKSLKRAMIHAVNTSQLFYN